MIIVKYFIAICVFLIGAPILVLTTKAVFLGIMDNDKVVDQTINQQRPTPTISPSPTPTQEVAASKKNSQPKEEEIWCTGPDYKQFLATQSKCNEFQKAWHFTPKIFPTTTPKTNVTPISTVQQNNYSCYTDSSGIIIHTKDSAECTQALLNKSDYESRYTKCKNEVDTTYNSCVNGCNTDNNEGLNACSYAYTGPTPGIEDNFDKYLSCKSEANSIWSTCRGNCLSNAYGGNSKTCP